MAKKKSAPVRDAAGIAANGTMDQTRDDIVDGGAEAEAKGAADAPDTNMPADAVGRGDTETNDAGAADGTAPDGVDDGGSTDETSADTDRDPADAGGSDDLSDEDKASEALRAQRQQDSGADDTQAKQEAEELADLKARADDIGVDYAPNIGITTLRERVTENEDQILTDLKSRADELGVEYGPTIGIPTLRDRVKDAEAKNDGGLQGKDEEAKPEMTGAEALRLSGDY